MTILERVPHEEYLRLSCPKIPLSPTVSVYAVAVICGKDSLGISWQSELIEPIICEFDGKVFFGIDTRVVIYDSVQESISLVLCLGSNFLSVFLQEMALVVLAELEVVILNRNGLSVCKYFHAPDLVESSKDELHGITIQCMDGKEFTVNY